MLAKRLFDVRVLQRKLISLRYDPGKVDGKYGQATQYALWAFEKVNNIPGAIKERFAHNSFGPCSHAICHCSPCGRLAGSMPAATMLGAR